MFERLALLCLEIALLSSSFALQDEKRVSPRLMATLPAGAVEGVTETLHVFEDLREPHAPIVYRGATTRFEITKSAECIAVENETALWGGHQAHDVMHAEDDVLGNDLVRRGEPRFEDVARLLPPVLATKNVGLHSDYSLDAQSFVGSRIASEKRAFSATGAGTLPGAYPPVSFPARTRARLLSHAQCPLA
jgi:hypothetical protein